MEQLEKLLDTNEVMDILRVSRRTLYRYVEKGVISAKKDAISRKLYFEKSEIERAMNERLTEK